MKTIRFLLALAGILAAQHLQAISLDNIQLWAGSGTNRAALVIEWSVPQSLTNSSVPVPIADKALVWGYRFNGAATGTQMLDAILAADPKLYVVTTNTTAGTVIEGIGYNLDGTGNIGITDGSNANQITNGILTNAMANIDSAYALDGGDLYWGGWAGPKWELWNETNDAGGFLWSPDRGTNLYWTTTDPTNFYTGYHGQWVLAQNGLDDLQLTNGSWIGFSIAAGEYESATNAAYNIHKHAPVSPEGTYVAYVCNTNDFATVIISTNTLDPASPYNNPLAVLGPPTLSFLDGSPTDLVSIVNDPYNVTPNHTDVITEIKPGGEITVQLGRRVYHDPHNPYGADFIVYGNSFFDSISGGAVNAGTDMNTLMLRSSAIFGHATTVSVSQDGINWYTNATPTPSYLFPDEAYRWDDTNSWWTAEQLNPNKPLNPFIYTNNFAGNSVAETVDQFVGAAGGTEYSLAGTGLSWIQYVRIVPGAGASTYTVIDAIAAVDPTSVGDALSILPDNVISGEGALAFQNPGNSSQNQISINFDSVNELARISTVSLSDFSPFAPVTGTPTSAYQIQARPITSTNAVVATADISLYAGGGYSGSGNDLRVYQWNCTNWTSEPFVFNPTNNEVTVSGVTNLSAFVVSQIVPPMVAMQSMTNGFGFQFTPVPNCQEVLERSTDLVNWTPIYTFTATNSQPMSLVDSNVPPGQAYYRVYANVP